MVCSGDVSNNSRAGLPTTISPDLLTETTLGTSLSPSSPGMILGPVRSMNAIRLLVVPRSMPTTRSLVPKSIWNIGSGGWDQRFLHFVQQILNILAAVQKRADGSERLTLGCRVVGLIQSLQVVIDLAHDAGETLFSLFKLRP